MPWHHKVGRVLVVGMLIGSVACGGATQGEATATSAAEAPAVGVPTGWPYDLDAQATVTSTSMVVTDAPLATGVGAAVLRAGGNAVDAAIATAFALAVVYPEAGNLGGGGFLVLRMADGREAALDFRERAPAAATPAMYLDSSGAPTDASLIGHRASGVPGSVAGLYEAHRRFGSRPWRELVQPAIELADKGFTVDANLAGSVAAAADRLGRFTASAALFLPGGEPLREGSNWRNPDLAEVLRRIASAGAAGFYQGETADLIATEMRRGGGLITEEDLGDYKAVWREPIAFEYRGHRVVSMPPPSSGGVTLALIANILENFSRSPATWRAPRTLHIAAEAMRRAFADRNALLGDPDFVENPVATLVSEDYAKRQAAGIDPEHATASAAIKPGLGELTVPSGFDADTGAHAVIREPDHTTHVSIVDAQGNAVALTTTINELYGSAVTVGGGGFLLNDEMDDFTAKPGEPNLYGLVQGEANVIAPGKRMLSAMTPTIVLDSAGRPMLITGARGGPRIISAVFQVISNVIDFGLPLGAAVAAPRIHHQHLPDVLYYEDGGLTEEQIAELRRLGHDVQARSGYIGNAPTILRVDGGWAGAPDPRIGGSAEGSL